MASGKEVGSRGGEPGIRGLTREEHRQTLYSTYQVEPSDGCGRCFLVDAVVFAGRESLVQGSQGHLPV